MSDEPEKLGLMAGSQEGQMKLPDGSSIGEASLQPHGVSDEGGGKVLIEIEIGGAVFELWLSAPQANTLAMDMESVARTTYEKSGKNDGS